MKIGDTFLVSKSEQHHQQNIKHNRFLLQKTISNDNPWPIITGVNVITGIHEVIIMNKENTVSATALLIEKKMNFS